MWPPNETKLVEAFLTWAGADAELRLLLTPDGLIGFDAMNGRGYLFDDGWSVEVWVERGLPDLLQLLPDKYMSEHCELERPPDDPSSQRGLLRMVLDKGVAINRP